LDVRLGADIQRITRGDEITVTWGEDSRAQDGVPRREERTQTFDRLILACPPEATREFLEWGEDERRLFEQIKYNSYFVTACEVAGMPLETLDALHDLEPGYPWEIMRPWPNADVGIFYTSGEKLTKELILQKIRTDVGRVFPVARVGKVLHQVDWAYFPHVPDAALADGYYDELEALQGQRSTYLTGGLPAFETVEHVVEYSHGLVERFFPPI
jgi:hypothetical protein